MKPFKDRLLEIITTPEQNAQNAGSLEDQFVLLLNLIDSDLLILFNDWKVEKGATGSHKLTTIVDNLMDMGTVLLDFYRVYLNDD